MQYTRTDFDICVGKIPWRREWLPTPVFLPGESYEQKSFVGYSQWGHKELDTTETFTFISLYKKMIFQVALVVKNSPAKAGDKRDTGSISGSGRSGGGHGIPFQYSCLENSMDRGAWLAEVHGVAKSRTWLKDWACIQEDTYNNTHCSITCHS